MKYRAPYLWAIVVFSSASVSAQVQSDSQRNILKQFEQAFIDLSASVRPSVVEISSEGPITDEERAQLNDLFRFFDRDQDGNDEEQGQPQERPPHGLEDIPDRGPRATASGFVYDAQGHIVTNNHVVRGADRIEVQLWDGQILDAKVVGEDPDADIAVIKVDLPAGFDLKPVELGDSDALKVGQFAIAMGSPNGLTGSFSYGHVTGLGRESLELPDTNLRFQEFIQTDAAINLGNSGGPLCDIDGRVIGVNVAIVYRANSIGFAIPVNRVHDVVPQLIANGRVIRGWLGVSVQDIAVVADFEKIDLDEFVEANNLPDRNGSYINLLTPGGPAEKGKLLADDVIREINGKLIHRSTELINTVSSIRPGDTAHIKLWRRGQPLNLDIVVGEYPGRMAATYGRDYLGMHLTKLELNPEFMREHGIKEQPSDFYVAAIVPNSPAAEAGIRRGDIVVEIAYEEIKDRNAFETVLKQKAKPGTTQMFKVWTLTEQEPRKVYVKVPDAFSID